MKEYDCGFTRESKWFRYRAAAIIIENDSVLFAGNELEDYYYSIGGGDHIGETAEAAVKREVNNIFLTVSNAIRLNFYANTHCVTMQHLI